MMMRVTSPAFPVLARLLLSCLLLGIANQAAGELLISPTRVVFEGQTRTASVSVVNAGDKLATYRIGFVQRRMNEDGSFSEIKTPAAGEQFADRMIRFSPRQVTLKPGQSQVIRLLLRKRPNLADGEYRSHLLFRAIPKATSNSLTAQDNKAIAIQLTPIMGISIPIIVRQGKKEVTAAIEQVRFYKEKSTVLFEIHRSGNNSLYGNISIIFIDNKGNKTILKKLNGLAVYTPNKKRRLNIAFTPPAGIVLSTGQLLVQYHTPENEGSRLLSEKKITLP